MIKTTDLNNGIKYINFEGANVTNDKTLIFAGNGTGKTSIQNFISANRKAVGIFNYEEQVLNFQKQKKSIIIDYNSHEINKNLKTIEDLIDEIGIKKEYKNTDLQRSHLTNDDDDSIWKKVSGTDYEELLITKENFTYISEKCGSKDIKFLLENYDLLRKKTEKLIDDLEKIEKHRVLTFAKEVSKGNQCMVCDNEVENLTLIITHKLAMLLTEDDEFIAMTKNNYANLTQKDLKTKMLNLIDLSINFEKKILQEYAIIGCKKENIKKINNAFLKIRKLVGINQILEAQKHQLYVNLKSNQLELNAYPKHPAIKTIKFNDNDETIKISLIRNVKEFSTGEIQNLFFEFMMDQFKFDNNKIIVIDDPLSSFDTYNQYKIAYTLSKFCKYTSKKIVILTHDFNLVKLLFEQDPGIFKDSFYYIDVINEIRKIYKVKWSDNEKHYFSYMINKNALSKKEKSIVDLLLIREHKYKQNDPIHKLVHWDGLYSQRFARYPELSNQQILDFYDVNCDENYNFSNILTWKLITLLSIRIKIEKIIYEELNNLSGFPQTPNATFGKKINFAIEQNNMALLNDRYPNITREDLLGLKVMLNHNSHAFSQTIPFQYAMSLTIDRINDLKKQVDYILGTL